MEVSDLQRKETKNPIFHLDQPISALSGVLRETFTQKFLQGVPFAYLLEEAEFYQHSFYVNDSVLIPRPETELLVDKIIQEKKHFNKMLDVGTGSGVILLSLMKAGIADSGMGSDFSAQAVEVARINAQRLRVENVEFQISDRLTQIREKFDLIVSNPPYIKPSGHQRGVHPKVDEFEPETALYIPDAFYENWFEDFFLQVKAHLSPGGQFWMEGHEEELQGQAQVLKQLHFKSVQVEKDWNGVDRFLFVQAP
jgi:release factor glutamine methyltransferase